MDFNRKKINDVVLYKHMWEDSSYYVLSEVENK